MWTFEHSGLESPVQPGCPGVGLGELQRLSQEKMGQGGSGLSGPEEKPQQVNDDFQRILWQKTGWQGSGHKAS